MNSTAHTGSLGEELATQYLIGEGYSIEARNWREGHYELDIVAMKYDTLHFIEVKTRRWGGLTPPEAAMTRSKQSALRNAITSYLNASRWNGEIQFDLISVSLLGNECKSLEMIENAVEYNW